MPHPDSPQQFPVSESPELDRGLLQAWVEQEIGEREAEFPWQWAAWDYTRHQDK